MYNKEVSGYRFLTYGLVITDLDKHLCRIHFISKSDSETLLDAVL